MRAAASSSVREQPAASSIAHGKNPASSIAAWVSVKPCASTMNGTIKFTLFRHSISAAQRGAAHRVSLSILASLHFWMGVHVAARRGQARAATVWLSLMPYAEPSSPCITNRAGMSPIVRGLASAIPPPEPRAAAPCCGQIAAATSRSGSRPRGAGRARAASRASCAQLVL